METGYPGPAGDRGIDRFRSIRQLRLALDAGHGVAGYPITEYWQDIGNADDYRKAIEDWERGMVERTAEAPAR